MTFAEKQDPSNFEYADVLLYRIREDAIEACNVAAQHPEVVSELMAVLEDNVRGHYRGSKQIDPAASAALRQVGTYSCEWDTTYLMSWEDEECCNDEGFSDWNSVWQNAIDFKMNCGHHPI